MNIPLKKGFWAVFKPYLLEGSLDYSCLLGSQFIISEKTWQQVFNFPAAPPQGK